MIRRPPRSTQSRSSAASDVYKRQVCDQVIASNSLNRYAVASSSKDGVRLIELRKASHEAAVLVALVVKRIRHKLPRVPTVRNGKESVVGEGQEIGGRPERVLAQRPAWAGGSSSVWSNPDES